MDLIVAWYGVSDFERAKRFYGETLGLKKKFEMQQWAEFAAAEGAPSIGLNGAPAGNGSPGKVQAGSAHAGATVVLKVADIEGTRASLLKKGVRFEDKIEEVPGVVRIATFYDLDGNRLQLAQVLV